MDETKEYRRRDARSLKNVFQSSVVGSCDWEVEAVEFLRMLLPKLFRIVTATVWPGKPTDSEIREAPMHGTKRVTLCGRG